MKELLWNDRKRFMGLPLSFTKYKLYEDKLIHSKGLLMVKEGEILLYRILDIELRISLLDRLFGVGTLVLYTGDASDKIFNIQKIKNPREVADVLNENVDSERTRVGIKGKELYGVINDR